MKEKVFFKGVIEHKNLASPEASLYTKDSMSVAVLSNIVSLFAPDASLLSTS